MQAEILYMDADMIAAAKPAGMASQPDRAMGMDLVNWLKNELARREGSPGQVLVVHRLDRPVAGVLVYARNQKAAAALSAQLTDGRMKKEYLAVLTGRPDGQPLAQADAPDGRQWYRLETLMEAEERKNRSRTSAQKGKKAVLFYCVLAEKETAEGLLTLVQIRLQTGRHHQIRVQMASAGAPLWGDTKYNPAFTGKRGWYDLALFARSLTLKHPRTGKDMVFAIPAGESITAHFADADRAADRIG